MSSISIASAILAHSLAADEVNVFSVETEAGPALAIIVKEGKEWRATHDDVIVQLRNKDSNSLLSVEYRGQQTMRSIPKGNHFVFDSNNGRFKALSGEIRIELKDYSKLDELVKQTGARSGKAFEHLGFALLEVTKEVHPGQLLAKIESDANVTRVQFLLRRPAYVPQ